MAPGAHLAAPVLIVLSACGSPASVTLPSEIWRIDRKAAPLDVTVKDADGQLLDLPVTWDLDESFATITEDGRLSCNKPGTGTVTARAGGGEAHATVHCHPDAVLVPAGPVWLTPGTEVAMRWTEHDAPLEVPHTLATSDDSVVAVGGTVLRSVGPGTARIDVRIGSVLRSLKVHVPPSLSRDVVYLLDPARCTVVAVDHAGVVSPVIDVPDCVTEVGTRRVLLDLTAGQVAWARNGLAGREAATRWLGEVPGPVESLGPMATDTPLALLDDGFAWVEPDGAALGRDGAAPLPLPDDARFVGADWTGAPCAAVPRDGNRHTLTCLRQGTWRAEPNSPSLRFGGLVEGGRYIDWLTPRVGKHPNHVRTSAVGGTEPVSCRENTRSSSWAGVSPSRGIHVGSWGAPWDGPPGTWTVCLDPMDREVSHPDLVHVSVMAISPDQSLVVVRCGPTCNARRQQSGARVLEHAAYAVALDADTLATSGLQTATPVVAPMLDPLDWRQVDWRDGVQRD